MEGNRQEMVRQLVALAKQNTLEKAITPEFLGRLSDSDVHGLLMVVSANRSIEDCLLQDALTHTEDLIEDFTLVDMDTAMRAWGGV